MSTKPSPELEKSLKPCPFCGSSNLIVEQENIRVDGQSYWVECQHCRTRGPEAQALPVDMDDGPTLAKTAWNERASR